MHPQRDKVNVTMETGERIPNMMQIQPARFDKSRGDYNGGYTPSIYVGAAKSPCNLLHVKLEMC